MNTFILHDTRPYPQTPVKHHLLINASLLAHGTTAATRKIAVGQLQTEIRSQLHQNYYVNLSVAMTMARDVETYNALMQSINQVLSAENDDEAHRHRRWLQTGASAAPDAAYRSADRLPVQLSPLARLNAKHPMAALPRPFRRPERHHARTVVECETKQRIRRRVPANL